MKTRAFLFFLVCVCAGCGGSDSQSPSATEPAQLPAPTPAPTPARPSSPTSISLSEGVFIGSAGPYGQITLLALDDGSVRGILVSPRLGSWAYVESDGFESLSGIAYPNGVMLLGNYGLTQGAIVRGSEDGNTVFVDATNGDWDYLQFSATRAMATGGYDYGQAANVADVVGTWSTQASGLGVVATVSVASSGQLSGNLYGCPFTGSAIPRPSGRNVFDITVKYDLSYDCDFPGETHAGVGVVLPNGSARSFIFGVRAADLSKAMTFYGVR